MTLSRLRKNAVGILMAFVSLLWLVPVYYMAINSFKPLKDVVLRTADFPKELYLQNFTDVWEKTQYWLLFKNSLLVTGLSVLGVVIFSSMAGYKLARSKSKWSYVLILYFILVLIIPFQSIMIPLVKIMNDFNMIDKIWGLVIVYIALQSPMAIFLYHGAVKSIPTSLEESAKIDGAGPIRTFFTVIFPLLKPITSTVIILNSLWIWNDFLLPLITLQSPVNKTIPLGTTAVFFGKYMNKWHWGITSIFLASLPMIILYIILQKYVIKGITEGATKG